MRWNNIIRFFLSLFGAAGVDIARAAQVTFLRALATLRLALFLLGPCFLGFMIWAHIAFVYGSYGWFTPASYLYIVSGFLAVILFFFFWARIWQLAQGGGLAVITIAAILREGSRPLPGPPANFNTANVQPLVDKSVRILMGAFATIALMVFWSLYNPAYTDLRAFLTALVGFSFLGMAMSWGVTGFIKTMLQRGSMIAVGILIAVITFGFWTPGWGSAWSEGTFATLYRQYVFAEANAAGEQSETDLNLQAYNDKQTEINGITASLPYLVGKAKTDAAARKAELLSEQVELTRSSRTATPGIGQKLFGFLAPVKDWTVRQWVIGILIAASIIVLLLSLVNRTPGPAMSLIGTVAVCFGLFLIGSVIVAAVSGVWNYATAPSCASTGPATPSGFVTYSGSSGSPAPAPSHATPARPLWSGSVDPKLVWQSTGSVVHKGDVLVVDASGQVVWASNVSGTVDADGAGYTPKQLADSSGFPLLDARCGSLIVKIGDQLYPAGKHAVIVVEQGGVVEFMVNSRMGWLHQNSGLFNVTLAAQ